MQSHFLKRFPSSNILKAPECGRADFWGSHGLRPIGSVKNTPVFQCGPTGAVPHAGVLQLVHQLLELRFRKFGPFHRFGEEPGVSCSRGMWWMYWTSMGPSFVAGTGELDGGRFDCMDGRRELFFQGPVQTGRREWRKETRRGGKEKDGNPRGGCMPSSLFQPGCLLGNQSRQAGQMLQTNLHVVAIR